MEITPMQLYWILKLDTIRDALCPFIALLAPMIIVGIVGTIICKAESGLEKNFSIFLKLIILGTPLLVLFTLAEVLIPSTKQMATLLVVPPIINNEQVQEMPKKILDLGYEWLDELSPSKKIVKTPEEK